MTKDTLKVQLYRLQQRLAITRNEATALLVLAALLLTGMGARYVRGQPRAVPSSTYAETDHRFRQAAARLEAAAPSSEENSEQQAAPAPAPSDTARMNLNQATAAQLERLPRVGPVISKRISAYRAAHGPFTDVEHLQRVSGIGPKTLERLAPLLFVHPAAAEKTLTKAEPASSDEQ